MTTPVRFAALMAGALLLSAAGQAFADPSPSPAPVDFAGLWVGTLTHEGESKPIAFRLERADEGKLRARLSNPTIHLWDYPLGPARVEGYAVRLGPMLLRYDPAADTLSGTIPAALVPKYDMPVTLRRSTTHERAPREELDLPEPGTAWTFDTGAEIWADVALAGDTLLVGADDGRLYALDARTGAVRWQFRAGGAIRAAATVSGADVFVPSDDGFLYRLDAETGKERWRVKVMDKPVVRIAMDRPESRYDFRASGVAAASGLLYLGTDDGRLLALDAATGARRWEFAARDAIVGTPVAHDGRVYFGSFDGNVYALDAASGALRWAHDTGGPVTTAPALDGSRIVIGSRSYDLFALETASGRPAWTRYFWFSWVESPAEVREGAVYVGSSDAARLFAFDAGTGKRLWATDVAGSAWGRPAVTGSRVFIGAVGFRDYMVPHTGGAVAVDRVSGRPVWRHRSPPPANSAPYGFASSPAAGEALVYFAGLDGRVLALRQ